MFDDALTDRIARFLIGIGIPVTPGAGFEAFLPGIAVREGGLIVDPARLRWPGDLLHDGGHVAVTEAAARPTLSAVGQDPAEEMAALAWSYAAAVHLGVPPRTLFHDGYKAGGEALATAFADGHGPGVPMLAWWGMTDAYPAMLRWLR